MKVFARVFSLLLLGAAITFISSCKKDNPSGPSAQEKQFDKLEGSWTIATATLDGSDATDGGNYFEGVTMSFSNFTTANTFSYSFTGSGEFPNPSPWPTTGGSLRFGDNINTQLERVIDDVAITYGLSNGDQNLSMSFTYASTGFAGGVIGRTEEVEGNWVFTLTKNP